jgi:hypothetical protein
MVIAKLILIESSITQAQQNILNRGKQTQKVIGSIQQAIGPQIQDLKQQGERLLAALSP